MSRWVSQPVERLQKLTEFAILYDSAHDPGRTAITTAVDPAVATSACGDSIPVDWQTAMRRAIRSAAELRAALDLDAADPHRAAEVDSPRQTQPSDADSSAAAAAFPTFVPLEYLARIRPGDPHDPLLRQVLISEDELVAQPDFGADPVGDLDALSAPGVLHKYEGRALVISTGACGIHCRYCFRREFPYHSAGSRAQQWKPAIEYLRQHQEIDEVILSGGDPLTLVDQSLNELLDQIEELKHVARLRIHTRMPVVIPQRVTTELVDRLSAARPAVWVVIHANHAQELDAAVLAAVARLIDRGIPVLNQAVLLRGVNDDTDTLAKLCRTLVNHRVQPYYLHQLDRVRGATHFEVPVSEGLRIVEELRALLPGYAVPSYVAEYAGEVAKTPLVQPAAAPLAARRLR